MAAELAFPPAVSDSAETESCRQPGRVGSSNPYCTQSGGLPAHFFAELRAAKLPQPMLPARSSFHLIPHLATGVEGSSLTLLSQWPPKL